MEGHHGNLEIAVSVSKDGEPIEFFRFHNEHPALGTFSSGEHIWTDEQVAKYIISLLQQRGDLDIGDKFYRIGGEQWGE
ncbi:MAG: hypothetical protein ACRDF4_00270 [Rhabdochlamydiaceae bacterium]